jgi:hypothetical protein
MLRRIFVPTREEVTGGWRKLHSVVFTKYYGDQHKEDGMVGHVARMGDEKCVQDYGWKV